VWRWTRKPAPVRITLVNGLLHIELQREVPEARKPRTIAINGGETPRPALQAAE